MTLFATLFISVASAPMLAPESPVISFICAFIPFIALSTFARSVNVTALLIMLSTLLAISSTALETSPNCSSVAIVPV